MSENSTPPAEVARNAAREAELARLRAEAAAAKLAAAEAAAKAAELQAKLTSVSDQTEAEELRKEADVAGSTAATKADEAAAKEAEGAALEAAAAPGTAAPETVAPAAAPSAAPTAASADTTQASAETADPVATPSTHEPPADPRADTIAAGYSFDTLTMPLGCALIEGHNYPNISISLPLRMMNRHGLVAGATGTGKTRTLQLMAEGLSAAGVPVFITDVKGDLSGLMSPGTPSEDLQARTAAQGQSNWQPTGYPTEFLTLGVSSEIASGVPVRTTVQNFGSLLLSRALNLNATQTQALHLIFEYCEQRNMALDDLKDLQEVVTFLTSTDEGKTELKGIGGVGRPTAGVILRSVSALAAQGGDVFFGLPAFDTANFLRTAADGRGVISLLRMPDMSEKPTLVSAFIMWLLNDLFRTLPEVGDVDKPKLVFFFDEAHLLFQGASKEFLAQVEQVVKLIRSKGVGIYFLTQNPTDIPEEVLGQLGSRVQHALRAFTPKDAKALRATVSTFPVSDFDLEELLTTLGVGEAIVTILDEKGRPSPVAPTKLWAPQSVMGPADSAQLKKAVEASALAVKYMTPEDRESAFEKLRAEAQKRQEEAEAAAAAAAKAEAEEKARKEAEKQAKEEEKRRREEERRRREEERDAERRARTGFRGAASKAANSFARSLGTQLSRELVKDNGGKKILGTVLKGFFK